MPPSCSARWHRRTIRGRRLPHTRVAPILPPRRAWRRAMMSLSNHTCLQPVVRQAQDEGCSGSAAAIAAYETERPDIPTITPARMSTRATINGTVGRSPNITIDAMTLTAGVPSIPIDVVAAGSEEELTAKAQ